MFENCLSKQSKVKDYFKSCSNPEQKYEKIIELGRNLGTVPADQKIDDNLVRGCQSKMYLVSTLVDGKIHFEIESDSLISSGLAILLREVYEGETPEVVLKCEPAHLEELGINASLTMNRANGLASLHLRMKQDALKLLMKQAQSP